MIRTIFFSLLSFAIGVTIGIGILWFLPRMDKPLNDPIWQTFGIQKPQIVGFLPYWLIDAADKPYENYINTLTYFGLTLDTDGKPLALLNEQEEDPGYTTLHTSWKNKADQFPNQRRSLLVFNADEEKITALLSDPKKNARNLIAEVKPIMQKHNFTDLNIDIESFTIASKEKQQRFTTFLQEVKKGLEQNNLGTLTIDISPSIFFKKLVIDPYAIESIPDYIVLMAYDYSPLGTHMTGAVAPILGDNNASEFDITVSIKEAIKVFPAHKILLGIPLYGYEWETIENTPGASTIPGGASTASHRRIEELLSTCSECTVEVDQHSQQPYVIFPDESKEYFHQIFYEDQQSLQRKLQLAQTYKLGGVALWALGYEGNNLLQPLEEYKNSYQWLPQLPFKSL